VKIKVASLKFYKKIQVVLKFKLFFQKFYKIMKNPSCFPGISWFSLVHSPWTPRRGEAKDAAKEVGDVQAEAWGCSDESTL
jgi:hypothetical protein